MFWSAECSLLRADGLFCNLDVLYGGLGIGQLQVLIKNMNFYNFWPSKALIRMRNTGLRLRVKQKEAIRIINNAGYRDHTAALFKLNCILPVDEMIKYASLLFMHRFSNRNLPLSFHDVWTLNRIQNPARLLRNANDLRIPPHNFATLKRLPLFAFPRTWNEEDVTRKSVQSFVIYKKQLKIALLSSIVI